jgi:hypothetical protein
MSGVFISSGLQRGLMHRQRPIGVLLGGTGHTHAQVSAVRPLAALLSKFSDLRNMGNGSNATQHLSQNPFVAQTGSDAYSGGEVVQSC